MESLETLSPAEVRAVLVNAQAWVRVTPPHCGVEHKTITEEGLNVKLTTVRSGESKEFFPSLAKEAPHETAQAPKNAGGDSVLDSFGCKQTHPPAFFVPVFFLCSKPFNR